MDRTISHAGEFLDWDREHEGFWLGLAALTLSSWSLMMWTWTRHLLASRTLAAPIMRTSGLSRLTASAGGRARPVHRTSLACCTNPCSSGRNANSACGCIQAGTVNFYVNFNNCSTNKDSSTKVPASTRREQNSRADEDTSFRRRQALNATDASANSVRFYSAPSGLQHRDYSSSEASNIPNALSACTTSTPQSQKFSSFDIVSSSEITSL